MKKQKRKSKKEKKRMFLINLIIIGLLSFLIYSVSGNYLKIRNNKKEIAKLNSNYEELLDEEKELSSEITKMQDPDYVARYAKEKYLYSSDGEMILRMDE